MNPIITGRETTKHTNTIMDGFIVEIFICRKEV